MAQPVCERYGLALFEASEENSCLEEMLEQTSELCALLGAVPEYQKLLSSPIIESSAKQTLLQEAFSKVLHPFLYNFLQLLAENGRFSQFEGIMEEFRRLYDDKKGILRVTAITAVELTQELSDRLSDKLSKSMGKTVVLKNAVDPSILGGVLLRYDNTELDASISAQLSGMKEHIKEKALS